MILDITKAGIAKRKGGRISRWAMKKKESYSSKKEAAVENVSQNEVVPIFPSCSTAIEDRMALNLMGSSEERESIENSLLLLCPSGNVEKETETETDHILAPFESFESGGMLCFNEILDNELLQPNGDSTTLSEWGGENNKDVVTFSNFEERKRSVNKTAPDHNNCKDCGETECGNYSNEDRDRDSSGDLNSSSSITSCFDHCNLDNLDYCLDDWESVVKGNELWDIDDDNEYVSSWLWHVGDRL